MTDPPFGKKSSITIMSGEGKASNESLYSNGKSSGQQPTTNN
jgi:hypothetical protein